jgi:hypothetical protein
VKSSCKVTTSLAPELEIPGLEVSAHAQAIRPIALAELAFEVAFFPSHYPEVDE